MSGRGYPAALVLAVTALGWLSGAPGTARAAEQRTTCPLWIQPEAFKANRPPKGWTAAMPQEGRLSAGGGLLWGAPEESGYLRPDEAKTTKNRSHVTGTARWKLTVPHSFEVWLSCAYGPLQLFKRIPVDATECTSTSKIENGVFAEVVYVCK
jgi:hypothetical protein